MNNSLGQLGQFVSCLLCCIFFVSVNSSPGDSNAYYIRCVKSCQEANCTQDGIEFLSPFQRPMVIEYFWSCKEDCQYWCMWDTVYLFTERNWEVPQFHGKWPFVRILGLQEPASVFFSILNLSTHLAMLLKFRREVRKSSPLYSWWILYGWVCINAWLWSTIFHARDTPLTEKMDYFCAFSMVLFSAYGVVMRCLHGRYIIVAIIAAILCILFFIHHVTYLSMVVFDYSYNMAANIAAGAVGTLGWLLWCAVVHRQQPYVWRCAAFFLLTALSTVLEVWDFPPLLWTIDAHSLFHLATGFLPPLLYRFLIDDCKYLQKQLELSRDETFRKKQ